MADAAYEQVGVIALREPKTGEFLPAIPLYIRAGDGVPADITRLIAELARLLADRAKGGESEVDGCDCEA